MTWSFEKALERAEDRYKQTSDLEIKDITREIDFDQISRTKPRRVTGTHFYVDVTTFNRQLRANASDEGEGMLRLLHIFAREVSKIVAKDFDGQKIHFQGPRLHALAYRPTSDESLMATKAVLTCLAIRQMTAIFNDVLGLSETNTWRVAAGLDHGRCIATRNGAGGDQELLFLGSAANHAAKLLKDSGIRMTAEVYDLLPDDLKAEAERSDSDDIYKITLTASKIEDLAGQYGWNWKSESTRARLEILAERFPQGTVSSTAVKERIDNASLALSNTKSVSGASIFADVDGFTGYIDSLESIDNNLREAIRLFHVLRGVMRDSATQDFEALRIQYQGDRMQAFAYRPVSNDEAAALEAIRLATALMTVADEVIPTALPELPAHRLAVGLAWGQVLVSKIGEHGKTDVISLGGSTADAASIQQRLDGGQIGINRTIRDLLPAWLQEAFSWSATAQTYVATDISYNDLADLEASEKPDRALSALALTAIGATATAALINSRRAHRKPVKPWSND
ncbi:Adenylate cyclase, class 3 [Amycolatopsis marina]|uniref:Adenylate cyclase, class 3 n=1 Tax=Amycolatopsis marina TaxID=490629 RepID=A0A1I1C8W3_9PSEU|nr:hypothetical protein [Amycolatopsis marina]SFB59081.1 Adenylate cyclase, class 3 [Amycolatopsis marina]